MKPLAAFVLTLSLAAAVATSVLAQTPPTPGAPPPAPTTRPDTTSPALPPAPGPPGPGAVERPQASDDPAALPRRSPEQTTIFGLSPMAAVVMATSLLVVVILAIVAMTRRSDAYIDLDRRE
jgi:hypothetical protein